MRLILENKKTKVLMLLWKDTWDPAVIGESACKLGTKKLLLIESKVGEFPITRELTFKIV